METLQIQNEDVLSSSTRENTSSLGRRFNTARPFKHIIVDDFFRADFAARLLDQFPPFEQRYAYNEFGEPGRKAVITALAQLSEPFKKADDFFGSTLFLDWVSAVTGIPNLMYDSENYGGGTHENLDGQELLPHVDFNYHPRTGHHRRLNVIVYLNPDWKEEWGGSIQVHSNPRNPDDNEVRSFAPIFNRCIMFETNEHSWHGFDRITLPADQKNNSRKSLSIYLYTTERPEDEVYAPHGTFYIPRPLPSDFAPGKVLSEHDVQRLQYLLRTRDSLLELSQKQEAEIQGENAKLARYQQTIGELLRAVKVPLIGFASQLGAVEGLFPDMWCGPDVRFTLSALRPVTEITIVGMAQQIIEDADLAVAVNGQPLASGRLHLGGDFVVSGRLKTPASGEVKVSLSANKSVNLSKRGLSDDERDLTLLLQQIIVGDQ